MSNRLHSKERQRRTWETERWLTRSNYAHLSMAELTRTRCDIPHVFLLESTELHIAGVIVCAHREHTFLFMRIYLD